jgi:hypothetical protein
MTALLKQIVLFIGMTLIVALYFWGHNVGDQPAMLANAFLAFAGVFADVLVVSSIALVSGGIGRRIGQIVRLPLEELHLAERIALESGLGLGALSIGTLLLGLLGLFNLVIWAVLVGVGLLLRREIRQWLRDLRALLTAALQPQTGWERVIVVIVGLLLIGALLLAFAPPFAWDGLTYHLVGPERYLQAGRIEAYTDNHHLGFPQGIDLLYGLALLPFNRATTAVPVHFYIGFLALLAIAGLIRRCTDRTSAYTGILLIFSSYSLWLQFTLPYVDLGMMLYGALALITISRWHDQRRSDWLALAGVCVGLAVGAKYTGGILGVSLIVLILIDQPRRFVPNAAIFGLAALVVFLPWMLKGILLYQNPVYPYIFGGPGWDDLRAASFNQTDGALLAIGAVWQVLLLPFSATFLGVQNYAPYDFTTGPWLFTMPLVLLISRAALSEAARRLMYVCAILALCILIGWMFLAATSGIGAQPRLMLLGVPVVAVLGTLAFHSLSRLPKRPVNIEFLMRGALVFTTLIGSINIARTITSANPGVYYVENNADRYLRANLGNYYAATRQLETLPADSTVLFMWEPKSFYCPANITCIPDIVYDHWSRPLRLGSSADDLMQQWRDEGVDYLLVWGLKAGSGFGYDLWLDKEDYTRAENQQFPAALDAYAEPVWTDDAAYTLYVWKDPS